MNTYPIIMAAMGVSLVMTMAILLIGSRGPWNSFWALFVILFLALWVTGIYVTPFGPVYLGVAWIPLMMAGVVFAVILLFAAPKRSTTRQTKDSRLRNESKEADADYRPENNFSKSH